MEATEEASLGEIDLLQRSIKKYKRSLAEGQESDDVYVTIGDSPTADMAVNQEV